MTDGSKFEVGMSDLDYYRTYAIRICINFASQVGASLMLLIVLFVLTRREKRAAPVFVLNASCLLVNSIRSILQCLYFTGPFYSPYTYFSGDYSRVPKSEIGVSISANTLTLILVMLVMTSLVLQVRVMLITASKIQRFWTMVITTSVALLTIAFRFALVVLSNETIMNIEGFYDMQWFLNATYITQAVSIWFFCVIFVVKLGFALSQRKKLGIQQLGPMQIIFIMGCQTMIVPAIFTALNYAYSVLEFASQTLTIVCLFLPLSAIWAGTAVDDRRIAVRGPDAHRKLLGAFGKTINTGSANTASTSNTSHSHTRTPLESPTSIYKSSEKNQHDIRVETAFDVARDGDMV
ncbi:uncharacterized protein BDZ99DRAFT_404072 [Mytilinidion resinicola]|uniref:Mating-type alpha-pheromone receptor PreB n=1 Tax=Mytilinidion resinicola TaxID=574789 RepID=A0A6A6Z994_9PEZI|nr:uncharacterized protein BDZ99DRAFT_404072 [Mytilinidion resinicola]KAF2816855.1 hypothetical protein BDZ99DRAFT_404072 [Mytilinidion resinicola]